jgi:hypothetical protein
MALEWEIAGWREFRKALGSDEDQEAFDAMMDMCRKNAMAGGNACRPLIFEAMVVSVLLEQAKLRRELEFSLYEAMWKNSTPTADSQGPLLLTRTRAMLKATGSL